MKIQDLLEFGFKEWPISPERDRHDRQFQYCVRDERGKKLYVQVRFWQFSKYNHLSHPMQDSFDAYCQYDMHGPKTFNVDLSVADMTPRQVVDWFVDLHTKLGCTYYELWETTDENGRTNSCLKCNRYLPPVEAVEPFLCPACKYLADTGFKPVIPKARRRHR